MLNFLRLSSGALQAKAFGERAFSSTNFFPLLFIFREQPFPGSGYRRRFQLSWNCFEILKNVKFWLTCTQKTVPCYLVEKQLADWHFADSVKTSSRGWQSINWPVFFWVDQVPVGQMVFEQMTRSQKSVVLAKKWQVCYFLGSNTSWLERVKKLWKET